MHFVGRIWSHTDATVEHARSFVVSQFHDNPDACLSIHSICTAGKKYGLVAGRWMGPYALCRAVADISRSSLTQHVKIHVIDSGGGAPCLDPARYEYICKSMSHQNVLPTSGLFKYNKPANKNVWPCHTRMWYILRMNLKDSVCSDYMLPLKMLSLCHQNYTVQVAHQKLWASLSLCLWFWALSG